MTPVRKAPALVRLTAVIAALTSAPALAQEAMVNYEDHIKPIFREHCIACHSDADRSSGLSLESYASALEGGSGGAALSPGDSSGSRLWRLINHDEQPTMPPDEDKIAAEKLTLVKTWIDQGMPENSGSKIKRKAVAVAAASTAAGQRPEGPPAMPGTSLFGQPVRLTDRAAAISALAASPWYPLVAVAGQSQVSLYHSGSGDLLGVLPFPAGEPQSITFSRDGRLVLVGGGQHGKSGVASLYDVTDGRLITTVGDEIDTVLASDISDDNSKIAIAGPKRIIRVYDTATGEIVHELKKHTDWVYSLRFSPDGILLASGDRSNTLVVWETDTGRIYQELPGHKGEIRSLDWRPDSMVLYSGSMDGTVKMWDMNNGAQIKSWDAHGGGVTAIDVCNDGTLATTGRDAKVKLWDGGGNATGELPALADAGMEVAVGVDSQFVVAGDWQGNVRLWDRKAENKETPLPANPPSLETRIAALIAKRQTAQAELVAALEAKAKRDLAAAEAIPDGSAAGDAAPKPAAAPPDAAADAELEAKIASGRDQITQLDASIEYLQEQLDLIDRRRVELAEATAAIAEKVRERKRSKAEKEAAIAAVDASLAESDNVIKATQQQLEQLQKQLAEAQMKLAQSQKAREEAAAKRAAVEAEGRAAAEELATLEGELADADASREFFNAAYPAE